MPSTQPPAPGRPGRVLIAARATTAVRVAASVRAHGMVPIGVITRQDRDARWRGALDEVIEVPAYDDVEALVAGARQARADLLHPGVGFAAESSRLARAAQDAGVTLVGPGADTLDALADKAALARTARELEIPVPRTLGPVRSAAGLEATAKRLGGPLVVKAVRGGGGRGVIRLSALSEGRWQASQVWDSLSGLGPVLVQEEVRGARHLEVQALGDGSGAVVTAGTRECSVQRRAQKLIEEAPAPFLPDGLAARLEEWTRRLLAALRYRGIATCEFLLDRHGRAVLLEVNARLQVEHSVTEAVTGTDLVRAQLALAEGARLTEAIELARRGGPTSRGATAACDPAGRSACPGAVRPLPEEPPASLALTGHAVEARIYAEDPRTLLPATGTVLSATVPVSLADAAATLRAQRCVGAGDHLTGDFSEPVALLTSHAAHRRQALAGLETAVRAVDVRGVPTLVPLLEEVLAHPDLAAQAAPEGSAAQAGYRVSTAWLEELVRPDAPGVRSWVAAPAPPSTPARAAGHGAAVPVRAPLGGNLVSLAAPGPVAAGEPVAVIEAMKMRLPVPASLGGLLVLDGDHARPGEVVSAGSLLARILPPGTDPEVRGARAPRRRARERLDDIVDPGSVSRLTEDDAVLTAWARVGGREVAVWIQDPTVHGGTMGLAGARRVAALIEEAAGSHVPVVSVLDGGGARIQEGIDALAGVGLVLAAHAGAHGRCLHIAVVAGSAAGGAAYAPALADVLVMVEGAGQLFLTGPAVLARSTGEAVDAESLGGAALHSRSAGTAHLQVPDEPSAWRSVRHLLTFAPVYGERGRALPFLPGGRGAVPDATDAACATAVPGSLTEAYDVRGLLSALVDHGQVTELRPGWAANVVTALARVDGVPLGIVATQPSELAGALDPAASQKIVEHLRLCARAGLPVLTVVDTPGFLPGAQAEAAGTIRHGARVVEAYASYQHAVGTSGALLTLITRRAFGGAYVALASTALSGARTVAWPGARIGVMDPASATAVTGRREMAAARERGEDIAALEARLTARHEAAQSAEAALSSGWIEQVIEPERTRAWLSQALEDLTRPGGGGARVSPLGAVHHRGEGWVSCRCGGRHWGQAGAAGLLVWRFAAGGLEVLLTRRAFWTHHGSSWGVPGGALMAGESSLEAALREAEEEVGLAAAVLRCGGSHVQEHGDWSYTTWSAQAPSVGRVGEPGGGRVWDRLVAWDGEVSAVAWVPLSADAGTWLPPQPPSQGGSQPERLLPALEEVWPQLARMLPSPAETEAV